MAFPLLTLKVLGTFHSRLERETMIISKVDTTATPALYIMGHWWLCSSLK